MKHIYTWCHRARVLAIFAVAAAWHVIETRRQETEDRKQEAA
jgi:hypothetical protein